MKKNTILIILCLAAVWIGCDDMLNVTSKTDFTDDNFWKTEDDLKAACNRLYQQFAPLDYDLRADDQVGRFNPNEISNGSWSIPTQSGDWTNAYAYIFTANNILVKAANAPVNENIRNRYLGEARFFRAWYYFDLVCKYGDVPLALKPFTGTTDPELKMARTPRETVIQQCYDDLAFAAEWLPGRAAMETVNDEFERRRITRSSALGLMVRIGLHEGAMLKYHNLSNETVWKAHLQKSIDAYSLLKAEGHQLYTIGGVSEAYLALFFDEENGSNKEVIFSKAYGPNGVTGTNASLHSHSYSCDVNFNITRSMVDYYLYADGLPREKSSLVVAPETSFNHAMGYESDGFTPIANGMGARDPRLPMSVLLFNDPQQDEGATIGGVLVSYRLTGQGGVYLPLNASKPLGYVCKKGFSGERWSQDYTDRIVIRWGEMLISYAEALYEINGSITDAQLDETVNALRNRVGFAVPLTNAFVAANGLDMREEIRRERTVELMAENRRYPDIIRWKIAETILPKAMIGPKFNETEAFNGYSQAADPTYSDLFTDASGKIGGVQEYDYPEADIRIAEKTNTRRFDPGKDYFYPIPSYEIAQSDGNITQNPGWR
ncbi:MAG: RagB/SusD family nutrient uptake outer membrane protein [Tannerella sp.]|jgi:hypothetical protein|nr:RagB/SusD family nutrient uptake outer membrane protein [Tannerella sp.]